MTQSKRSRLALWWDILSSVFRFNISILDYFYFRFFLKSTDRYSYAGTGFMYEYQLRMNPRPHREVLADKLRFAKTYKAFITRRMVSLRDLASNPELLRAWWTTGPGRLVVKYSRGQVGAEVMVVNKSDFSEATFLERFQESKFDMVEDYVQQHPDLMRLSPSGLNTVRIVTQVQNGQANVLAARLRISVNSAVDNLAAGNLAAPIDLMTGRVTGPGVYSDITKPDQVVHPVTHQPIVNFQVPFWSEVIDLTRKAAMAYPANRSVGWDVAITDSGVQLIEGNHNWCKLLWQLPVKRGLKNELSAYV